MSDQPPVIDCYGSVAFPGLSWPPTEHAPDEAEERSYKDVVYAGASVAVNDNLASEYSPHTAQHNEQYTTATTTSHTSNLQYSAALLAEDPNYPTALHYPQPNAFLSGGITDLLYGPVPTSWDHSINGPLHEPPPFTIATGLPLSDVATSHDGYAPANTLIEIPASAVATSSENTLGTALDVLAEASLYSTADSRDQELAREHVQQHEQHPGQDFVHGRVSDPSPPHIHHATLHHTQEVARPGLTHTMDSWPLDETCGMIAPGPLDNSQLNFTWVDESKTAQRGTKRKRGGSRAVQTQVAARRTGPLSTIQRDKADEMRYHGACWRCRRYKKPCNGPGICDACITSGFRVWPSSIGCRRGNAEDFVRSTIPLNAESEWKDVSFDYPKPLNWRIKFGFKLDEANACDDATGFDEASDKWAYLKRQLHSTQLFGRDLNELLQIAATYQRQADKEDPLLDSAQRVLSATCDWYHAVIRTETPTPPSETVATVTRLRNALFRSWRLFLNVCLGGRRTDWLRAFLSGCLYICMILLLVDGVVAVPESLREMVWPDAHGLADDMRFRLYGMLIDVLNILAKGAKPLTLDCWHRSESITTTTSPSGSTITETKVERDPAGMKMVDNNEAAFDGFCALREWTAKYGTLLRGGSVMKGGAGKPFAKARVQPISALAKVMDDATAKPTK